MYFSTSCLIYSPFLVNAWFQGQLRQLALLRRRIAQFGELHEEEHLVCIVQLLQREAEALHVAGECLHVVEATLHLCY